MSPQTNVNQAGIATDGRVVDSGRDPPGQRSIYITPVDTSREVYRLTTYSRFPDTSPINPCVLALYGFYYTGFSDRVKCFSCGRSVDNWTASDDASLVDWHARDCPLATGNDVDNVPLSRNRSIEFRRRNPTSVTPPPTTTPPQRPTTPTTRAPGVEGIPQEAFPCLDPVNPHMRNLEARLQTFQENIDNWPAHRIRATPREMAQAGLYYLGQRDRAKCWYCNGGLQNWDINDDPWFEHAKWFPQCEFLLQKKGPFYIHNVVSQYPDLNRPQPINPSRSLNQVVSGTEAPSSQHRSSHPVIVDPREQMRAREARVEQEMTSSVLVEQARQMGFSQEEVRFAMLRRLEETDDFFPTFSSLVESLISHQESAQASSVEQNTPSLNQDHDRSMNPSPVNHQHLPINSQSVNHQHLSINSQATSHQPEDQGSSNLSINSPPVNHQLEELRHLQQSRVCKVCLQSQASVVFLPCGHLSSCPGCAENLRSCPVCKSHIREKVNSFIV